MRGSSAEEKGVSRLIVTLLLLAGCLITIWPVGETLLHDRTLTGKALTYEREQRVSGTASAEFKAAQRYNAHLDPRLLTDPWGDSSDVTQTPAYAEYLTQLGGTDPMATIVIPKIGANLPIVHGTTAAALKTGVGHFFGSALPVGGKGTNAVLAGHHTLPGYTFFTGLEELAPGDDFMIHVAGQVLTYRVVSTKLIRPTELDAVAPVPGKDLVSLVTCITPKGGPLNYYRLVVQGERIPTQGVADLGADSAVSVPSGFNIEQWMWPRIAIAGVALVLLAVFAASWVRRDRATRRGVPRRPHA